MKFFSRPALSVQIPVALVFLLLGILLSIQFKTQQELISSLISQSTEDLVAMWKELDKKHRTLEMDVALLQKEKAALLQKSDTGKSTLGTIQEDIKKLRMVNGLSSLEGPGITIKITGDTELLYLDLVDIINELYSSGAEAIAINNHRVTFSTSLSDINVDGKVYITINGQRLLPPIVIKALGNPHTLEKGLTFPGGLVDNLGTLYSIHPQIKKEEKLVLPGVNPPPVWLYARTKE